VRKRLTIFFIFFNISFFVSLYTTILTLSSVFSSAVSKSLSTISFGYSQLFTTFKISSFLKVVNSCEYPKEIVERLLDTALEKTEDNVSIVVYRDMKKDILKKIKKIVNLFRT